MDTAHSLGHAADAEPADHQEVGYPRNCWWVAATVEEVGTKLLSRRLLEQPVVLFRTQGGAVVALEDRCPHRRAPLSLGRLLGDEIACPYHGFRYDTTGACTHIPTQTHIPPSLTVRSYPVCEHGPFVWIWMGDVRKADKAQLPAIFWPANPTGARVHSYGVRQCSYASVQENYMDLAHILFLHSFDEDWLQYGESPQSLQFSTAVEEALGGLVRTTKLTHASPLPLDAKALGMDREQKINSVHRCTFFPPGCFFQEEVNDVVAVRPGTRPSYGYHALHCTTPVSPGSCHWWRAYAYDFGQEATEEYQARWDRVLKEDCDLLEAIQRTNGQDKAARAATEVFVHADRAVAIVRRLLQEMVQTDGACQARIAQLLGLSGRHGTPPPKAC